MVGYARVSTEARNLNRQRQALRALGCKLIFEDKASGKSMDRPAWNRLWSDVEAGKVCRIVVWRLDRLGRTCSGLSKLFEDLVARKIGLFSLKDSIDLETSAGRLMANVLASVAAYEREVRTERQRAGIDAAKAKGKQWGGSEGAGQAE